MEITLKLFFTCLDMLSKEPPWCDGSNCYECVAKFGVTTRKHHWLVAMPFYRCKVNKTFFLFTYVVIIYQTV